MTDVTYLGFVHGTMAALKSMRPRGAGRIIQMGSALGLSRHSASAAYCGAKHAIRGFTDSLRAELLAERSRITVSIENCRRSIRRSSDWARAHLRSTPRPMGRPVEPEVVADAVYRVAGGGWREYWLGLPTIFLILGDFVAPGALDRYLAATAIRGQQTGRRLRRIVRTISTVRSRRSIARAALSAPRPKPMPRWSWARSRVWAPWPLGALVFFAAGAAFVATRRRDRRWRAWPDGRSDRGLRGHRELRDHRARRTRRFGRLALPAAVRQPAVSRRCWASRTWTMADRSGRRRPSRSRARTAATRSSSKPVPDPQARSASLTSCSGATARPTLVRIVTGVEGASRCAWSRSCVSTMAPSCRGFETGRRTHSVHRRSGPTSARLGGRDAWGGSPHVRRLHGRRGRGGELLPHLVAILHAPPPQPSARGAANRSMPPGPAGRSVQFAVRLEPAVLRSLLTLKSLAHWETGGIVAAGTTSLPEQLGGERNWDYRYCWLRDSTFTLLALIGAGYLNEAKAWLNGCCAPSPDRRKTSRRCTASQAKAARRIQIAWLPGYEGAKPVRIGNAAVGSSSSMFTGKCSTPSTSGAAPESR